MSSTVKPLKQFVFAVFALMLAGLCFSQSETKTPPASKKSNTQAASPTSKPKARGSADEEIPPAAPDAIFPAVVARVNGRAILGRDLERVVQTQLSPMGNPDWNKLREDYRGQLVYESINQLINSELIYQKATASGRTVADSEVQAEFDKMRNTFKSDAEMNIALANQQTDRETLKEDLAKRLVLAKYVDETIDSKVSVTPEEVTEYYSSHLSEFQHPDIVRTSHILIQAGATAEQDAYSKRRAEALLARIKKGEDFATLARNFSMDESASQGGDVGFSSKDALIPEYAKVAFSLPVGGVAMVKSDLGYHIIKVTEKKPEGLSTLEEIRSQLTEFLKNERIQDNLNKLVEQLRGEAQIESLIPAGQPLTP
jgi:peptidyl-prolyl cis-trans isomerase C